MHKHHTPLSIRLPKKDENRLREAALRYSVSPDLMARRVIADATHALLQIPEESLDEYDNKEGIVQALWEGLRDYRRGIFLRKLPKRISAR